MSRELADYSETETVPNRSVVYGPIIPLLLAVICRQPKIPKATCLQMSHDDLRSAKFYSRWGRYTLDTDHTEERVTLSHRLLQALRSDEEHDFTNVVTGDESWFFLETSVTPGWLRSRDHLPSRPKRNIEMEKCLISTT